MRVGIIWAAVEPQPAQVRRQLPRLDRADRADAGVTRHRQPARLPPGPLQRGLPGRGRTVVGGQGRRAAQPAIGLSRQLLRQPRRGVRLERLLAQRPCAGRGRTAGPLRGHVGACRHLLPRQPGSLRLRDLERAVAGPRSGSRASNPVLGCILQRRQADGRSTTGSLPAIRNADPTTMVFFEPNTLFVEVNPHRRRHGGRPEHRVLLPRLLRHRIPSCTRNITCSQQDRRSVQQRDAATRTPAASRHC